MNRTGSLNGHGAESFSREEFFRARNNAIAEALRNDEAAVKVAEKFGLAPSYVCAIGRAYGISRGGRGHWVRPDRRERDERICAEYLSGTTLEEISANLPITRERVRQILLERGIVERHYGVGKPSRVAKREAHKVALAAHEARADARRQRKAEKAQKIISLYRSGMKYTEICREMGYEPQVFSSYVVNVLRDAGELNRSPCAYKPKLSPAQRLDIAKRYSAGEDIREIAGTYDVTPGHVRIVATKLGYYRNGRPEKRESKNGGGA